MMEAQTANVTYFPYTFLQENDLKRLILYFDRIRLLQVLPDLDSGLPAPLRTSSLVQSFCPLSSSPLLETIRRAQQIYHQLASVHRDAGLVQLFRTYAVQEDFENSRTGLVARIRQGLPRLAPEEVELVSDAVFLLFAHELDREHLELDLQLDRIRGLETKLHEEVGIGTEEEREAVAMKSPVLLESDPPRAQYPLQRLRAWTRLCSIHPEPVSLLPLTTSLEVLGEITERLPSHLAALTDGLPATPPSQHLLAILPDPQPLSLEEILKLRESLGREGVLNNWWDCVAAVTARLERETLTEGHWRDLQKNLQKAADEFRWHWPTLDKPSQTLRLDSMMYPGLQSVVAFALATGLQQPVPGAVTAKAGNGITLLLSPAALPQGDGR